MRTVIRPLSSMHNFGVASVALIVIALLVPAYSFGQSESASVSGRVTDQQGAVIPDVEVEMRNVDTSTYQRTKTNGDGVYGFPSLSPGNYIMSVRKEQFQTVSVTGITLHVQDSLSRNFVLQVGSSAVSITVSASEAMWATTDSPAVSTVVTRDFVENMPLNGRSFQDLILLTPGVVSGANDGFFSINGQREDANNFLVDGVSANFNSAPFVTNISSPLAPQALAGTLPGQTALGTTQALLSLDAMQEFRIETSGYTAEYGRQPGGEVQLTSRSGTNDWHGTAFDHLRNTVFDANSWFANQAGVPRQPEHQNDFGGTIGGPVVIPHLYNGKDKTFFFFSYEGLRLLLPNFLQEFDPTLALRKSAAPGWQPFLNAFPIPNGPANTTDGCTVDGTPSGAPCDAQFNAGYSNPSSLDAISVRVDHNWGHRLRLFGRYGNTPSSSTVRQNNAASQNEVINGNSRIVTVGATGNLKPDIVNDFRFNYSQNKTNNVIVEDGFGGAVPFPVSLFIPPQYPVGGTYGGGVGACLSATAICGGLSPEKVFVEQRQYNLTDNITWIRGGHAFKFGVDYRRLLPTLNDGSYQNFVNAFSVASLQQGIADDAFIGAERPVYPRFNNLSAYVEDHWKLTSRLTLDYGVRWEFNPPPGFADGLVPPAVTQVSDISTLQLAPLGTAPYETKYLNFAPRVGFAWNVVPSKHVLVIRGGFGVYYDTGQAQATSGALSGQPPFANSYDAGSIAVPILPATVSPPVIPNHPVAPYQFFSLMDPRLKLPYTEQYNLSVDYGVSARNTLTGSYVGNQGHRLLFTEFYNGQVNADFLDPTTTTNAASSNYSALQIQDKGYLAPGLQLIASYTWAHSIDNASYDYNRSSLPLRGNSDLDLRQLFSAAINYQIPGAASNRFVRGLTHGWLLANRFTAQTGMPIQVVQGFYVTEGKQQNSIYPDLVPGVPIYLHGVPNVPGGWELNRAAFSEVPLNPDGSPVRQGDLPRNFLKGPGFWNLGTALQRTFPIRERLHLIFRIDAFNVFNHPNFTGINSNLPQATFGQATGTTRLGIANQLYATGAARSLQFMLKLQF